jgi:hypothetical protein
MTPEVQRIAIAEACGWKNVDAGSGRVWGVTTRHKGTPSEFDVCVDVPNYPFDLNAMHEAENFLFPVEISDLYSPDLVKEYASYLPHMCIGHPGGAMRATASQRAEAFLRTIGKWKEAK